MKSKRLSIIHLSVLAQLLSVLMAAHDARIEASDGLPLDIVFNERGIEKLTFREQSFLKASFDGRLEPFGFTPLFEGANSYDTADGKSTETFDHDRQTLTLSYRWGMIVARFHKLEDTLSVSLRVINDSERTLTALSVQLARMTYSRVPKVSTIEVGHLTEFTGGVWGIADSRRQPPVVLVDFESGSLIVSARNYATDSSVGVAIAEEKGLIHKIVVQLADIPSNSKQDLTISLQFGLPNREFPAVVQDALKEYAHFKQPTLNWPDRRPVGKTFLASTGNGPDRTNNPNRWFMNADIDARSDEGKEAFRRRLLRMADETILALKHQNAQGCITWDIEGQRPGPTYYGDPRILKSISPEMEFIGSHQQATIDAYFQMFTDAGLLHGICIRPQRLRFEDNFWHQDELKESTTRQAELDAKISYANKRWQSRLFYIDSDFNVTADEYRQLARKHPDCLLIPEWKSPLHHAYTSPLRSYSHRGVADARTPSQILTVFPHAFSIVFADGIAKADPTAREALSAGARSGDILMINSWYISDDTEAIRRIYLESRKKVD